MAVFFLILVVLALLLLGVFAVQNSSTEQVNFLTFHWPAFLNGCLRS